MILAIGFLALGLSAQEVPYAWHPAEPVRTLAGSVPAPEGYRRVPLRAGSFGDWLRHLPLKEDGAPVLLHSGLPKARQDVHHAVVDIDVGERDLQQCADAVIRLRAEYLFAAGRPEDIRFHFTSGDEIPFLRWARGDRPVVQGRGVTWRGGNRTDASHDSFRRYLDTIFAYAGTQSLAAELVAREPQHLQAGDVFIRGGSPGHAVLVVDVAFHPPSGELVFLLVQSYMPAQDIHLLRNPADAALSPWYRLPADGALRTPEWIFQLDQLRRFPGT